jgi:dephospho-CoA kinase
MLKVGITGGIGSGKTMVCKFFEILGISVYYADYHARRLMETDPLIRQELVKLFGSSVVSKGKIDRKKLALIIFNDTSALKTVNNLVHPAVRKNFITWLSNLPGEGYIIEEAAILFESGAYKLLNFNITVSAPEELRIKRVMTRDNTTREEVLSRISRQMTEQERQKLADAVIMNDESELLIPQVIKLHNRLLQLKPGTQN